MAQQASAQVGKRRGTRQYIALACVIVLLLAAAGALSFYSDEIHLYVSLGGWNRGAATRLTRQFIHDLQAGQTDAALALVDPESYQPYKEDSKVVGLEHVDVSGRGRYRVRFDELVPAGRMELKPVQLTASDRGGGFVVPVRYPDGAEGWFVVGRTGAGYRIVSVPTVPGRFHY
jgi:hypothetical protein